MLSAPEAGSGPPPSIYASLAALNEYLAEVRLRRAARLEARRKELQVCIEAVRAERLAAELDGDFDIAAELLGVEERFEEMLARAHRAAAPVAEPVAPPAAEAEPVAAPFVTPTLTVEETAELAERTAALRAQVEEFLSQPLTREDGSTDRSRLFSLRALGARARQLGEAAQALGAAGELAGEALAILMDLDGARPGANDRFASAPFTVQVYTDLQDEPSAEDWGELADAYQLTAEAQEVWEWFGGRAAAAGDTDPTPLLCSIAARQQILYRALLRMEAEDELQAELYARVKDHAKRTSHYLKTLEQQCADATLAREASQMEERRAQFEEAIARVALQREAAGRREAAIVAVEEWWEAWRTRQEEPDWLEASREALLPRLQVCAENRVPPSNVRVRTALLDRGLDLLDEDGPHAKLREAVAQERLRRGLDAAPVDDEADVEEELDDEMLGLAECVAPHTRGKRVLILGGVPKGSVVSTLEPLLDAEVVWEEVKKSHKPSKFRAAIGSSDILLVLKNLAGHDISEKGREWVKAAGGQFVMVTAGYGPKQLLHRLSEHFALRAANHAHEA